MQQVLATLARQLMHQVQTDSRRRSTGSCMARRATHAVLDSSTAPSATSPTEVAASEFRDQWRMPRASTLEHVWSSAFPTPRTGFNAPPVRRLTQSGTGRGAAATDSDVTARARTRLRRQDSPSARTLG